MADGQTYKTFQGGIGLAVATLLAAISSNLAGWQPDPTTVAATAYIFGYIAKQAGLKVED